MVLVLGTLGLLLPMPIMAQNLIQNPGFDSDLSGWVNPFGYPAVWDSRDASNSASSGSTILTNTIGNGGSTGILRQCLEVSEGSQIDASAMVYQASGQTGEGVGSFRFTFYSDTTCQNLISTTYYSSAFADFDTWFEVNKTATAPASTAAVLLYLAVSGQIQAEDFSAHFDDVVLTASSSPIFADGFEIGNTSAWSSAVP